MNQSVPAILETKVVMDTETMRSEWRLINTKDGEAWKSIQIDKTTGKETDVAWLPLPGSQMLFLSSNVFETLYHGTRGGGKTLLLLMDFAKEVGKGYGKGWRGILFRQTFGDLDDVVRKIEDFFPKIFPGFRFLKSKSEYMAIWPGGETLLLRHMVDELEYQSYHGHEYPWIGFEELTQWANDKAYKLMFSCCRPTGPGIPCRIRATTNPHGVGHGWVRKRFRLPEGDFKIIHNLGEVPRVAIRGTIDENFLLLHSAPGYKDQIKQAAISPAQERAWLLGDWTVTAGGMIDDIFDRHYHVIPSFPASKIPRGWTITRAYDHGQSHPFAVGWWLESNGEPINIDGKLIGRIRGDLILYAEWYGTKGGEQEGLRMSARKIAQGILDRESDMGLTGRVHPGPADTEIWSKDSRGTGRAPFDDMVDIGVYWERADKSPGSRVRGWQMLRTFLEDAKPNPDGTREKPGLYVCINCRYWLEFVPEAPRDPKDPDNIPDNYEDHMCDMTRYRVNWEIPGMWRKGGHF